MMVIYYFYFKSKFLKLRKKREKKPDYDSV